MCIETLVIDDDWRFFMLELLKLQNMILENVRSSFKVFTVDKGKGRTVKHIAIWYIASVCIQHNDCSYLEQD